MQYNQHHKILKKLNKHLSDQCLKKAENNMLIAGLYSVELHGMYLVCVT